jgi:hypothetical protein
MVKAIGSFMASATKSNTLIGTALALAAILLSTACQSELNPEHHVTPRVIWKQVGTWSGHGSTQTDSFDMSVMQWRVQWKTSNETAPGKGKFVLTANSAVSGRPLTELVRHDGPGDGTAYVTDDPRLYHLVIDSNDLDWTVTVEQPIYTGN